MPWTRSEHLRTFNISQNKIVKTIWNCIWNCFFFLLFFYWYSECTFERVSAYSSVFFKVCNVLRHEVLMFNDFISLVKLHARLTNCNISLMIHWFFDCITDYRLTTNNGLNVICWSNYGWTFEDMYVHFCLIYI